MDYKSIKVPEALWVKLKELALEKRMTIAQVIEEAVKSLDNASK